MKALKCDLCGAYFNFDNSRLKAKMITKEYKEFNDRYDLCTECTGKFLDWLICEGKTEKETEQED